MSLNSRLKTLTFFSLCFFPSRNRKLVTRGLNYFALSEKNALGRRLYRRFISNRRNFDLKNLDIILRFLFFLKEEEAASTRALIDKVITSNKNPNDSKVITKLIKAGFLNRAEEAAQALEDNTEAQRLQLLINEIRHRLGPLAAHSDAAALNSLFPDSLKAISDIAIEEVSLEKIRENKGYVVFYIPLAFYHSAIQLPDPYADICKIFLKIYEALIESGKVVVPVIQHNWREIPPISGIKAISYHTKGSCEGHLRVKESPFKGFFTIDPCGYSGWISLTKKTFNEEIKSISAEEAERTFELLQEKLVKEKVSKYLQSECSEPLPKDYIFLALQNPNDVVSRLAQINTIDLLKNIIRIANRHPEVQFVVKPHPKSNSKAIAKLLKNLPCNIHQRTGNIHNLIERSIAVLTVNSGVGAEALLYLKPVITTGASDYSPATIQAEDPKMLSSLLLKLTSSANTELINPKKVKAFLHYYHRQFLICHGDKIKIQKHLNHL